MKAGVPEKIKAAGGGIFAITSEPQTLAREAEQTWELDFPAVGDPHHEIADACRERGWLQLFVNPNARLLADATGFAAHPKGYFQPGVLAITRTGRVLYRWRSRPTRKNAGGATGRPRPEDVWRQVEAAISRGDAAGDAAPDEPDRLDQNAPPWPVFVGMLLANGKFLRPKPVPLARGGPDTTRRDAGRAMRNLALFVAGWIAGFALLPTSWVVAAFVGWAISVTPGVRELHRQFQSVPEGEPERA